jgi:hypothetical protein
MLSFKQFLIEKAQSPERALGTTVVLPDDDIEHPTIQHTIQQWMQQLGRRPSSWGQWPYGDHDGDGIPNVNDPDSGSYDDAHPESDPDRDGTLNVNDPDSRSYNDAHPDSDQDLDGTPNWMDPDFPGSDHDDDGILNINDPDSDEYNPRHPGADPDGDGTINLFDDDDDNDGILDHDDDSQWGDVFDPDAPQMG